MSLGKGFILTLQCTEILGILNKQNYFCVITFMHIYFFYWSWLFPQQPFLAK